MLRTSAAAASSSPPKPARLWLTRVFSLFSVHAAAALILQSAAFRAPERDAQSESWVTPKKTGKRNRNASLIQSADFRKGDNWKTCAHVDTESSSLCFGIVPLALECTIGWPQSQLKVPGMNIWLWNCLHTDLTAVGRSYLRKRQTHVSMSWVTFLTNERWFLRDSTFFGVFESCIYPDSHPVRPMLCHYWDPPPAPQTTREDLLTPTRI